MAIAAADLVVTKKWGQSPGVWGMIGTYAMPASYASGGEVLTNAIVAARLGIKKIYYMNFTPLVGSANASFDGVATATSQGKIHAYQGGGGSHTHSFLVKGGQAAASTDAISIKGTTPVTIGKEAATDATNIGGAGGGVQAAAAVNVPVEVVAGQDLSANTMRFIAIGC